VPRIVFVVCVGFLVRAAEFEPLGEWSGMIYHASMGHIKKSWVLPGGGMFPGLVSVTMEEFGTELIIGGGGAVAGHPMGARADRIQKHRKPKVLSARTVGFDGPNGGSW
jgi:hypothetical protein